MKFGSNLQSLLTPEWRSQYIDYESLKDMIYHFKDELPVEESVNYIRHFSNIEEDFFVKCDAQLSKVNNFFAEKLAEARRRFNLLQSELETHKKAFNKSSSKSTLGARVTPKSSRFSFVTKDKIRHKTMKELKLAFTEYYLSLVLLQNYQELNFTGFRKILKKHDKVLKTNSGANWRKLHVESAPFHTDRVISDYIKKTEDLYINGIEKGDRSKAMKRLRVPPLADPARYPKATIFKIGFYLGISICLFCVILFAFIFIKPVIDPLQTYLFYRSGLIVALFCMYIGLNILGWRKYGVNHVLIFEIDPRQHLSHQHFFEISSLICTLWAISVLCYQFGHIELFENFIPINTNPGVLYLALILFFINPIPVFFSKARFWLLERLWRLVACGFYPVEFADFWIADQLNSLVVLFLDSEFMICFYAIYGVTTRNTVELETFRCGSHSLSIRALLSCYPAYIRFVQCIRRYYDTRKWFPHLINAGKYSTTFIRVAFYTLYLAHRESTHNKQSVYFFLWIASSFISSCYTFSWDIKMDWGFLDENAGENKYLREEIVYQEKFFYYVAIIENLVVRFSWVASAVVLQFLDREAQVICSNILILLEVTRRFIWNYFRLENEHLNNCGEFRAVRDISVTPTAKDGIKTLERMINEPNGAESVLLQSLKTTKSRLDANSLRQSDDDMSLGSSIV